MMDHAITSLEPQALWRNFSTLNAIPRPSKKEERVITFIKTFGRQLQLETIEDAVGNVVIRKPATKGMEHKKPIVMQAHLDMVHQKNSNTVFDFETQGIAMYIEDDWIKARGTTLGADNGIGVATIMAILESNVIAHPDLEALFTIDEETGMTGAKALSPKLLKGKILLNLDTEDDDEIGIGCTGGVDITATKTYKKINVPEDFKAFKISITGLQGGHSGMQIHEGLGNANKILNRLLYKVCKNIHISEFDGGSLRNAIPRESETIVAIQKNDVEQFKQYILQEATHIHEEFKSLEPHLDIQFTPINSPKFMMNKSDSNIFIKTLQAAHNGVFRMSPSIPNLVETSNNIARVIVKDETIHIGCLTRSSVESSKYNLTDTLGTTFVLGGFKVELSGDYPGWAPNPNSEILNHVLPIYKSLNNGKTPHVAACHAGLECGIIGQHYPDMDMISFGPNIKGAHSPDECVQISSVQKYWRFALEILKQMP